MSKTIKKLTMEDIEAMIQSAVSAALESKEDETIEIVEESEVLVQNDTPGEENIPESVDITTYEAEIEQLKAENAKWKALFDKKQTTDTVKPEPKKRPGWGK